MLSREAMAQESLERAKSGEVCSFNVIYSGGKRIKYNEMDVWLWGRGL